ncbi:MAG: TIGR03621 family F420-dependent LLM class oxidoreductase [Gammaproteobacteria bacterium]|nr:TIGR03621 family F420-dependent LLM class oxidoreductase [Gammaproteobacteria bacterium]
MTATPRPFRFGLISPAANAPDWLRDAREAESRGYSTLALTDHIDLSGAHVTRLAWIPALAAAAAVTTRLRFTVMVANQDLRHPAVLARDVATLDVLSSGRFELGLGAGWAEKEYLWAGLRYDSAGRRIERLGEYVAVMRGLLRLSAGATFSFTGRHFRITDMPGGPCPLQTPLPLMLGGARPRMLAYAGRCADIVNILTLQDIGTTAQVLEEKLRHVRAGAGERFAALELATPIALVAGGHTDPLEAVRRELPRVPFAQHLAAKMPLGTLAASAFVLAGDTARIVAELQERRERWGLSYYVLPAEALADMQPVIERLAGR